MGQISIASPALPAALLLIPSAAVYACGLGRTSEPTRPLRLRATSQLVLENCRALAGFPTRISWRQRSTHCLGMNGCEGTCGFREVCSGRFWRRERRPVFLG